MELQSNSDLFRYFSAFIKDWHFLSKQGREGKFIVSERTLSWALGSIERKKWLALSPERCSLSITRSFIICCLFVSREA